MRNILRVAIGILSVFFIGVGLGFLVAPAKLAAGFFVSPLGIQGLATLRADFPGFFIGAGGFALLGTWRADPRPLLVPMLLVGLALFGRVVSILVDGMAPTAIQPMVVEAVTIGVLALGYRRFAAEAR